MSRLDLSKPDDVLLREQINLKYGQDFTEKDLIFNVNRAQQYDMITAREKGCESYVRMDWYNRFDGQKVMDFNQASLEEILGKHATVRIPPDGPRRTDKLVSYIYDQLGIYLRQFDVWIEYIPADATEFTIKLSPRHLALKGEIRAVFIDRRLDELLLNGELDGFNQE